MSQEMSLREIHEKLNFLLKEEEVNFDESNHDLEDLSSVHAKVNALLENHKTEVPEGNETIEDLQPKLDMLIKEHRGKFEDEIADANSIDTVDAKLAILIDEETNP